MNLRSYTGQEIDLVNTVCDSARAACPFFSWAKETLHKEFRDPTGEKGTEERILAIFRDVRDQVTRCIDEDFDNMEKIHER